MNTDLEGLQTDSCAVAIEERGKPEVMKAKAKATNFYTALLFSHMIRQLAVVLAISQATPASDKKRLTVPINVQANFRYI
jgi:hypothetical protein